LKIWISKINKRGE